MSYNGIGLSTARGSGTNGYIQKNTARVSESSYKRRQQYKKAESKLIHVVKDQELVQREQKRELEVKVSELRDELEDEGLEEDEIERRCDEFRAELTRPQKIKNQTQEEVIKEDADLDY